MWSIGPVQTEAKYNQTAYLESGLAKRGTIQVTKKAVFIQVLADPRGAAHGAASKGGADWGPEEWLPVGAWPILRKGMFAVRARSAEEEPATIGITLFSGDD